MRRGPNPMHAYLAKRDPRTLCGVSIVLKRRVLVPLALHALRADVNPCVACLREAERLVVPS